MDKVRSVFSICASNFKKWPSNPRIYVLVLSLFAFVHIYSSPIRDFSKEVGVPVTPWLYPYLTCNRVFLLLLMLGIVLLFCDAPFLDNLQPYIISRCGRLCWICGQILYIILASAIYFAAAMLFSVLSVSSNLQLSPEWGKVLGTLAQTDADISIYIPYKIQVVYTPVQAMLTSFFLSWFVGIFLGLVIFALNVHFKRAVGGIAASVLVIMDSFALNSPFIVTYFSPISWASLAIVDSTNTTRYPSMLYAVSVLAVFFVLLSAISAMTFRKKSIDILPSL